MSTIKLKYKLTLKPLPVGSFTSVATRPQGVACAYLKQIKKLRAYIDSKFISKAHSHSNKKQFI